MSFGVRQLIDIADRALSPGVNDPTTAVQVLDELHSIFLTWARRGRIDRYIPDDEGVIRIVDTPVTFQDSLWLSVSEITRYGKDEPRITGRIAAMLEDLAGAARPEHLAAITSARERLATGDYVNG